jgi:hypothetical protein
MCVRARDIFTRIGTDLELAATYTVNSVENVHIRIQAATKIA